MKKVNVGDRILLKNHQYWMRVKKVCGDKFNASDSYATFENISYSEIKEVRK